LTYEKEERTGPEETTEYYRVHGEEVGLRRSWVAAAGVKGMRLSTTDGGDGQLHLGHLFEAGLQYHLDNSSGGHEVAEVYGLYDAKGKAWGFTALWHNSLVGPLTGGMELGTIPDDAGGHTFFWAVFDIGLSFEL
jgi:hypothetical protein